MGCGAFLVHFFGHKKNLQGWNLIPCRFSFAEREGFASAILLRVSFETYRVEIRAPVRGCEKALSFSQKERELHFGTPFFLRRERDSNPRNLSVQRFSRPPQSTTLPSLLQNRLQKYCFFLNCANFYALFLRISIFYSNFAPKIVQKCCYKYSNPRYTAWRWPKPT